MSKVSDDEKNQLNERRFNFDKFLEERMPVLVEFFESLGFQNAYMVLLETDDFVEPFSDFMENQTIDNEDRNWIHVRVGYFVGEWYVQSKGGFWEIDENPESKTFAKYCIQLNSTFIDPFEIADAYLSLPIGRRLEQFLN